MAAPAIVTPACQQLRRCGDHFTMDECGGNEARRKLLLCTAEGLRAHPGNGQNLRPPAETQVGIACTAFCVNVAPQPQVVAEKRGTGPGKQGVVVEKR